MKNFVIAILTTYILTTFSSWNCTGYNEKIVIISLFVSIFFSIREIEKTYNRMK